MENKRILAVIEEELNRIVLDVHDGPVQNLFAALSLLAQIENEIKLQAPESPTLLPKLHRVNSMVEASLNEIKSFLGTFRSPDFRDKPLADILESVVIQHEGWTQQNVDLTIRPLPSEVPLPIKIGLYRILQEALSNAFRHAEVDQLWVRVWSVEDVVCLRVQDKGKGFQPPPLDGPDATEREEHIGLRGMRDRIGLLGGDFELRSQPGEGTTITVRVSLDV